MTSETADHPASALNPAPASPPSFDTAPPEDTPTSAPGLRQRMRDALAAFVLPLMQRGARGYVGGATVGDAVAVAERLARAGAPTTLGYWPEGELAPAALAAIYCEAIARAEPGTLDSYISIKPPALRYDAALAREIACVAREHGVRLHCDSHGRDTADASHQFAEAMLAHLDARSIGVTLPGRWARSLDDAGWAAGNGFSVRVVKGQWPDPDAPENDVRAGFLSVVDRLAGRARHVAVATHDLALAREALARLQAAGTSCELEVLLGMPAAPLARWAGENGVSARIYVPFGPGYIPNALGILRRNPRLAWRIIGGMFARR